MNIKIKRRFFIFGLKTTTVSNPISQAYIDRTIKSKENSKITNKLIRNEDMTKEEAIKQRNN